MVIPLDCNSFFVFDLDDTLFHEIDFLKSAYREIAETLDPGGATTLQSEMWTRYRRKENVFAWVVAERANTPSAPTLESLLTMYRNHRPDIALRPDAARFLTRLRERAIPLGLITDGRSSTQRNKLVALGIQGIFSELVISEEFGSAKPDRRNYLHFQTKYPDKSFTFIGDNTAKDFIVPASIGWTTICIADQGQNIHPQTQDARPIPDVIVGSFDEIELQ